jgi:hypothetical protein
MLHVYKAVWAVTPCVLPMGTNILEECIVTILTDGTG